MKWMFVFLLWGGLALERVWGAEGAGAELARAAREQIGKTVRYDPQYRSLKYPGGDVPLEAGVCTDVVVRALRRAWGVDLQRLVHEDMKADFGSYPRNWNLKRPDKNIDHRRVPNLETFFKRKGLEVLRTGKGREFRAGDLVICVVPPHLPHVMIVSDRRTAEGRPLVLHNVGGGVVEEDRLLEFRITGQYRMTQGNLLSSLDSLNLEIHRR